MVRHVILWNLKEGIDKEKVKKEAKENLESLIGKVPGLIEIKINICPLDSSNCDMMLDSLLEDENALKNYATHPAHVHVADTFVRPYTEKRTCIDYEV